LAFASLFVRDFPVRAVVPWAGTPGPTGCDPCRCSSADEGIGRQPRSPKPGRRDWMQYDRWPVNCWTEDLL